MAEEKIINVEWLTDRYEDDIVKAYKSMALNLLSSELSVFGLDDLDKSLILTDKLKYVNKIITKPRSNDSNFSIGATIAAFSRYAGPFIIPPDLIDYIREEIQSQEELDRYLSIYPSDEERYEKGKELFEELIKADYPTQAAYMLCGAAYIECGWNVNQFNKAEAAGGGVGGTGGWSGCGEGLFGLTFWRQKQELIKKLNLNNKRIDVYEYNLNTRVLNTNKTVSVTIPIEENLYKPATASNRRTGCLFQCKTDIWVELMKVYIESLGKGTGDDKTTYEYLMYKEEPLGSRDPNDDDHKLLYSGYLFKAGNGYKKEFDSMKKCVEKYKKTHERMYGGVNNPNFKSKNGFVDQILVAYLLSLYVNDVPIPEINLDDIIKF